jgi:hypothetical protein
VRAQGDADDEKREFHVGFYEDLAGKIRKV